LLSEGEWQVSSYLDDSGDDATAQFNGFAIDFFESGEVLAEGNGQLIDGSWLVRREDGDLRLDLNFGLEPPFDILNDNWEILEVSDNEITVFDTDSESVLVLRRI